MANIVQWEPIVCPQCGELIIASVTDRTVAIPLHPDLSWPSRNCVVSARTVAATKILL